MRLKFPQFRFIYRQMKPPKPGNTNSLWNIPTGKPFYTCHLHGAEKFPLERPEKPCLIYFATEIPGNFCEWLIISLALSFRGSDNSRVYSQARLVWTEWNFSFHLSLSYADVTYWCQPEAYWFCNKRLFCFTVTNLKNKNYNYKQWCLLFQIETDESLTIR